MGLFKTKDEVAQKKQKKLTKKEKKKKGKKGQTVPSEPQLDLGGFSQESYQQGQPQFVPQGQYQNNSPAFTDTGMGQPSYQENPYNQGYSQPNYQPQSGYQENVYQESQIPEQNYYQDNLNPGLQPEIQNFVERAEPTEYQFAQSSINIATSTTELKEEFNPRQETIKEGMAPSAYKIGDIDYLIVGNKLARVFCIEGIPEQVYIGYIWKLYASDYDVDINLSITPRQQSIARKELQDKLTIVRAQLDEEIERGANRNRDNYTKQIEKLELQIRELSSREELAFEAQFLFTLYADSREELSRNTIAILQELKEDQITAQVLAMRQDEAFRTVVPYCIDYLNDKKRNFNTGATISSVPFYAPELYDENGVFLGINTYSGTPALIDIYRAGIQNSNLNIFGSSGSGKSTVVKVLTMRSTLHGIRSVIIDPEGEYGAVTRKLHGANIKLSTNPSDSLMMNIFDIEEEIEINEATGEQIRKLDLRPKYEDILGFVKVAFPAIDKGQEANLLEVIEDLYLRAGFIDGNVESLYYTEDVVVEDGKLINNFRKRRMPQLGDLINLINNYVMDGTYYNLKDVYDALQPFRANKTRGIFDTQTPQDLQSLKDSPVINFDISGLESSDLKTLAMYVMLSWVWEKFGKKNPHIKKRIIVDEAWMMMSPSQFGYEYTSSFLETMSRRIRKRNGGLCVASQRIDDFNQTQQGKAVITNAFTTFLLNHQESEVQALRKAYDLDEGVIQNVINVEPGRVLIKQGTKLFLCNVEMFNDEKRVATTSPTTLS